MCRSAPRVPWRLVEAIEELDEPGLSIAELWRRLGAHAAASGLQQPSYQQTRVLVHRSRSVRALPGLGDLAVDVMFRTRDPSEVGVVAARRLEEKAAARAALERERTWRPDH